ncbi:type II toxin-antitoxin system VapC family toxin [Alishewanella sp. WH16-1]|uniref:type II toxin-antitoxin system VapC family toxin n=1 Tax=Alishewanella sp. WH16-1 TaxID=1651088 RepID=UPI0018D2559D|nr:type II toxin-antitoxin system VapC family toxin [Alishewanella sp. WH16-1]
MKRQALEDFVSRLIILPYGDKTAQHYGEILAELENTGTPIDVNDLHIRAHSRSESLTLVTNNQSEF